MPFPSLCTRWAVFRVPLAPQFYDTLPSGLCPSFGGSESIYLAPAVLPRVRHIALPGPAGRKDHPLPLLVLADALFGKELVQLSRRYAEFVSDARALEPVPVLDKLLVEYDFRQGFTHHLPHIIGKTKCDGIQNQMRLFGGRVSPKRKATKISHTHTKKHRSNGF